jgi:hypothetical protein
MGIVTYAETLAAKPTSAAAAIATWMVRFMSCAFGRLENWRLVVA